MYRFVKAWLSVYLAFKNYSPTFKNPSIQSLENNSLDNPCDLEDSRVPNSSSFIMGVEDI